MDKASPVKTDTQTLETQFLRLRKEDGMLHATFIGPLKIDLATARSCVQARIAFSEGTSYPCLIDMMGVLSVDKEARDYLAREGSELITAGAFLINSVITRTIVNLFLVLNRPPVPTKMFTDKSEALKWLRQFV